MILNRHDPKTFDLSARAMGTIFDRFRRLYQVCERKHGCASDFLLGDKDPLVLEDLKYRQKVAASRVVAGYDHNKAITACKSVHVDWAALKPTPQLEKSRWYKTLSPVEKDRLCAAIAQHKKSKNVFFIDSHPNFGRSRASNWTEDGRVISSCVMPQQTLFIFDKSKPKREPRIVLGQEAFLLCGFPTDIIGKMDFGKAKSYPQQGLQNLAGNMVPVPVFMALFLATLASVPWKADGDAAADAADDAAGADAELGADAMTDTDENPESAARKAECCAALDLADAVREHLDEDRARKIVAAQNQLESNPFAARGGVLKRVFGCISKTEALVALKLKD